MATADTFEAAGATTCTACSTPLDASARFCPRCGLQAAGQPTVDLATPTARRKRKAGILVALAAAAVLGGVGATVAVLSGGSTRAAATVASTDATHPASAATDNPTVQTSNTATDLKVGSPVNIGPATITVTRVSSGGPGGFVALTETAHMDGVPCYSLNDFYLVWNGNREPDATTLASNVPECTQLNAGETGSQAIGFPVNIDGNADRFARQPLTIVFAPGGSTPLARWDYFGSAAPTTTAPSPAPATSASAPAANAAPSANTAPATSSRAGETPAPAGAAPATASLTTAQQAKYGPRFLNATNALYARWTEYDVTPNSQDKIALLNELRSALSAFRAADGQYPAELAAIISQLIDPATRVQNDLQSGSPLAQAQADWTDFDNIDAVVLGSLGKFGIGPGDD